MCEIYLNNKFVAKNSAFISVFDHGFMYGDGVFETLRAYKGRVFMLDEHIKRLYLSAKAIQLKFPWTAIHLNNLIYRTLRKNNLSNAYVRIAISRGKGEPGMDPRLTQKPTLVIYAKKFKPYPIKIYQDGVKVITVKLKDVLLTHFYPKIKSANYLVNKLASLIAYEKLAFEAIFINENGLVTEGSHSNIFAVKNSVLFTPPLNIGVLDGVTRKIVIMLAKENKISCQEKIFTPQFLCYADECFLTNTTGEIIPIVSVNGKKIRKGKVGSFTKFLHSEFNKIIIKM
jgi:branched-chain amino acid aminotransferase